MEMPDLAAAKVKNTFLHFNTVDEIFARSLCARSNSEPPRLSARTRSRLDELEHQHALRMLSEGFPKEDSMLIEDGSAATMPGGVNGATAGRNIASRGAVHTIEDNATDIEDGNAAAASGAVNVTAAGGIVAPRGTKEHELKEEYTKNIEGRNAAATSGAVNVTPAGGIVAPRSTVEYKLKKNRPTPIAWDGSISGSTSPRDSTMGSGSVESGAGSDKEDLDVVGVKHGSDMRSVDERTDSTTTGSWPSESDIVGEDEQEGSVAVDQLRTTVMLRNIPYHMSRDDLVELMELEGFFARFDFLYMPMHFSSGLNFGYAFVNLVDAEQARSFWDHFTGFAALSEDGEQKETYVSWSVLQGLEENVSQYRNSQLLHPEVVDGVKPAIFRDGARAVFPPPTKPLRKPRVRSSQKGTGKPSARVQR